MQLAVQIQQRFARAIVFGAKQRSFRPINAFMHQAARVRLHYVHDVIQGGND